MECSKQKKLALQIFKGKKYAKLRKAIKDEKCFNILLPLAKEAGAVKHWDEFIDEWKYQMGCCQDIVTDEMRIEAFYKLKDTEYLIRAGCDWSGITDEMRIEAFYKLKELKDENRFFWIGWSWKGITPEMLMEELPKVKEEKNNKERRQPNE